MKVKKKVNDRQLGTAEIDIGVLNEVKKICKKRGIKIYAYVTDAVHKQLVKEKIPNDGN